VQVGSRSAEKVIGAWCPNIVVAENEAVPPGIAQQLLGGQKVLGELLYPGHIVGAKAIIAIRSNS